MKLVESSDGLGCAKLLSGVKYDTCGMKLSAVTLRAAVEDCSELGIGTGTNGLELG